MEEFNDQSTGKQNTSAKVKGIGDFLLIIRDRWLLALTLAVPVALAFTYVKSQGIELYRSSSSFRLIPPPAILNLQKVDRDQHIQGLVAKHLDGLNSSDLRANVAETIKDNPELKSHLLSPYLREGIPVDVGSAISYSIGVSPPTEEDQDLLLHQLLDLQEGHKLLLMLFSQSTKNSIIVERASKLKMLEVCWKFCWKRV